MMMFIIVTYRELKNTWGYTFDYSPESYLICV